MARRAFACQVPECSVFFRRKRQVIVVLLENHRHSRFFFWRIKGTSWYIVHENRFFVQSPRHQVTIPDAEQPGFFPGHETERHKFSRQIGILRGKELRLAQSHHVSNGPWGQNQRATKRQNEANPHPSPVISTQKNHPGKDTASSHMKQGSLRTNKCTNATNTT